ncbi:MAG: thioredoxin-disulfide reductase [Spirochaetales bacterium]
MSERRKVIIIGSGPAAHTAAIYAARAELEPLLFEGFMAGGVAAGGQLTTTTEVENFPGFPEGIQGPALMMNMRQQSVNCGATIKTETVSSVSLQGSPFVVTGSSGDYQADTVIVATGATAKRLDLPGEKEYWQKGISACAVCDGGLPIFREKPLVVIGGGDTACEEASYLSKFGSKVTILVRRDVFRASKAMQERVFKNPKIEILWNTEAMEAVGEQTLTGIRARNNKTGEETLIPAGGLFYAIGHTPNTEFLAGQLETDDSGYVKTAPDSTQTNIPGVFACGDVKDRVYRQAVTAAGSGCMAALEAEHYLVDIENIQPDSVSQIEGAR